ncbi:MAG: M6 family metalloprotease domain-containing protein [Candidatus Saccharicenans sp.]|nr:MAG: hypothetical protein C0168_01540 [Candidatus Aminicenantes bacterium]HEK85143.1 M6 family metalloprotease domain-containing protein [Candidatus Aminicenantes bacterium]
MAISRKWLEKIFLMLLSGGLLLSSAFGLEPPTKEQIKKYKQEGTYAARVAAAKAIANYKMDPELVARFNYKMKKLALESQGYSSEEIEKILAPPPAWRGMPTKGTIKVLALLIAFQDYPPVTPASTIAQRLFGPEQPSDYQYPYESLRAYYQRSSYQQLDIQGDVLGWYITAYPRSQVTETSTGRDNLIKEALNYYKQQGHDFSQYDNNNDGIIDYFLVFWTGPHGEWASFWWGYQTSFSDSTFVLDGKRWRKYSWQWELYDYPSGQFSPKTSIHETGHALGLPDYYDYDDSVGPRGGVGGLDMMDSTYFDHNCFSKFVLDWLTPSIFNAGRHTYTLRAAASEAEAMLFFPTAQPGDIFNEYFMVQNRYATGNDRTLQNWFGGTSEVGLAVWHVDARLNNNGRNFLYDNSYTDHKLLMLMQADGLDEIEKGLGYWFNPGDFYRPGNELGPSNYPNTNAYNGAPTGLGITSIQGTGSSISFQAYSGTNPKIRLSFSTFSFGNVNVCTFSDGLVTIYNDGDGPLTISDILRSSGASDFSFIGPACPFVVPVGSFRDITFRFNVYDTGPLTAGFLISSNDPDYPQTRLDVSGFGFVPEITLSIQVDRKIERAWIIRRSYAVITIGVNKSAPFIVDSYRLSRSESGGSQAVILKNFQESDFQNGSVTLVDKYLEPNKNYIYTIEAIDCYGRVINHSTQGKQPLLLDLDINKGRTAKPILKRG